jgi:hypothetical protein
MTDNIALSNTTQPVTTCSGSADNTTTGNWYEYTTPYYEMSQEPVTIVTPFVCPTPLNNKKGDDDMRYLYEVILVNPKNDEWFADKFVAKTETSALMQAYDKYSKALSKIKFDDLKTSCKTLFEWKKEKSLKKAIETIKEAVE